MVIWIIDFELVVLVIAVILGFVVASSYVETLYFIYRATAVIFWIATALNCLIPLYFVITKRKWYRKILYFIYHLMVVAIYVALSFLLYKFFEITGELDEGSIGKLFDTVIIIVQWVLYTMVWVLLKSGYYHLEDSVMDD